MSIRTALPDEAVFRVESDPVKIAWHWSYHLPGMVFWLVALIPLILLRENRDRQAWMMLVPLLAVLLAGRLLAHLLGVQADAAQLLAAVLMPLATGWSIFWMLAHRFLAASRLTVFLWGAAIMMASEVLFQMFEFPPRLSFGSSVEIYLVMAGSLILPIVAIRRGATSAKTAGPQREEGEEDGAVANVGEVYGLLSDRRLVLKIISWTVLATLAMGLAAALVPLVGPEGSTALAYLVMMLPLLIISGTALGLILFLVQYPYLLVVLKVPLYRRRFAAILGVATTAEEVPTEF